MIWQNGFLSCSQVSSGKMLFDAHTLFVLCTTTNMILPRGIIEAKRVKRLECLPHGLLAPKYVHSTERGSTFPLQKFFKIVMILFF